MCAQVVRGSSQRPSPLLPAFLQAAEIDARHRAAMGGQLVSAAADANTVAAWVYGEACLSLPIGLPA